MTIPNILCAIRLALAPVLLIVAWDGHGHIFIGILIFAFFLDAIDGPIARWTGQITELGPKLDSWADFAIFAILPLGVWWLWPEIILQEKIYIALMLASLILPVLFALIRFRTTTSYHTWLVKLAVFCTAVSTVLLLIGGPEWPFRISAILCILAAIEQIMITLMIDRPASDVKTLYHILKRKSTTLNTQHSI